MEFRNSRSLSLAIAAVAVAGMVSLVAPRPAAAQQELLERLQSGIERLQEGKTEEGLAIIEKVIEDEPRLAQAHFYAGQASAQMQKWEAAYDHFVAATQQMPGFGEAHVQACRVAYALGNYDDAYMQAIWAAQAGVEMTDAFAGLEAVAEPPSDWRRRLQVPRVLIGPIDTEALLAQEASVFGGSQAESGAAGADERGVPPADPFEGLADTTATGAFPLEIGTSGTGQAAQLQAEIHEVRRRFGEEFVASEEFGVTSSLEAATHVLLIKVDDIGEGSRLPLRGFVKLFDARTEEEVYSRRLELSDVASVSTLRNEIGRYLGYMEEWARERLR